MERIPCLRPGRWSHIAEMANTRLLEIARNPAANVAFANLATATSGRDRFASRCNAINELTSSHNHKLQCKVIRRAGIEAARRAATAIAANLARKNLSTPRCEIGGDRRAGETWNPCSHPAHQRDDQCSPPPLILLISNPPAACAARLHP